MLCLYAFSEREMSQPNGKKVLIKYLRQQHPPRCHRHHDAVAADLIVPHLDDQPAVVVARLVDRLYIKRS